MYGGYGQGGPVAFATGAGPERGLKSRFQGPRAAEAAPAQTQVPKPKGPPQPPSYWKGDEQVLAAVRASTEAITAVKAVAAEVDSPGKEERIASLQATILSANQAKNSRKRDLKAAKLAAEGLTTPPTQAPRSAGSGAPSAPNQMDQSI